MYTYIKNIIIVGIFVVPFAAFTMNNGNDDDQAIVNEIKKISNFTKQDQDPRFLFLDKAGRPLAALFSFYVASKISPFASTLAQPINTLLKNEMLPSFMKLSEENIDLLVNEDTLKTVGFLGSGYQLFNFLDTGTKSRILKKVADLVKACEKFFVVTMGVYDNKDELKDAARRSKDRVNNGMWGSISDIAIYNGLDNLVYQCEYALNFLHKVGGFERSTAYSTLVSSQKNLQQNLKLFSQSKDEAERRRAAREIQEQGREYSFLALRNERLKSLSRMWNLLKDIGKTGYGVGKFTYKNKGVIAGTAAGAYLYKSYQNMLGSSPAIP